jgi:hypothetical protein
MKLSAETIAKMRVVIDAVLAEPKFYDQWLFPDNPRSKCGTICCAAGWVVWIDSPHRYQQLRENANTYWPLEADEILGIESGSALFLSPGDWPKQFRDAYNSLYTPENHAKAMAARWEHYIATDGAE